MAPYSLSRRISGPTSQHHTTTMAAPINDHSDKLYDYVCDIELPSPDLPSKWTAEAYHQRSLAVRQIHRSARDEGFSTANDRVINPHNRLETPEVEVRMNVAMFVFVNGDCVTDENLRACAGTAQISMEVPKKIRDTDVRKICVPSVGHISSKW